MSSKLPPLNLIKNKTLNINLRHFSEKEIMNKLSRNKNILTKNTNKNKITSINSIDENDKIKKIDLASLLYRKPKTIYNQPFLNSKKKNNDLTKNQIFSHSRIFGKSLFKSSSVKLFPTGYSLKRLTIGNIDEIQKFAYYQKIENSKSYQDYLLKERAYIPQESIDNSFVESLNNINKDTINNSLYKKSIYNRNSIYNFLNNNKVLKINSKFKNQDKFEKYIIEKYIENQKKNNNIYKKNINNRYIFFILDGEIIINEYNIKGYFIEIPKMGEIHLINEEKSKIIIYNILKKCEHLFKTPKPLISIFTPDKELIIDIKEIKEEYNFLYVSSNIICKGISLVTTPHFLQIYKKGFNNYLKIEKINNKLRKDYSIENHKKKYKFKIKEKIQGIKPKYEKYKPHYSFAEGENDLDHEEFNFYSDDEKKKSLIEENILKNCYLKYDFFLYINKNNTDKKISELKSKLKYDKPFDLRESYKKFNCNFDKLVEKYKKQIQKQLGINPKIYKKDEIDSKVNSHNLKYPKDKLTNLYLYRNNKKPFEKAKIKKSQFYHCIDKNVTKYYTPFILYNIPKLLSEFKNYTRRRLYEIYSQYKDLVVMSYAKYKSDFILKCGVDFDTFWFCVESLSDEKKKFVEKIYNQINRSKLCVLSMEDFLTGMYFIQNSEITEKLDLFLKALDISGKGVITYNEAVEICKDSIQRNLSEKKETSTNDVYALNELSQFFASFIFKLIGVDKNKVLKLDDLKKAILGGDNEFNEIEYLEMFCGANN